MGDCWLISTIAATAHHNPNAIRSAISPQCVSPCGAYSVRVYVEGKARYILVDSQIPVQQDGTPTFVQSQDPNELWPVVMEKAFAKWAGGWENLAGGLQNSHTPIGSASACCALAPMFVRLSLLHNSVRS